jgi:hypothetical protein
MARYWIFAGLIALSVSASSEEIYRTVGPVRMKGIHARMKGPFASHWVKFPRRGWITGFTVNVLDSANRPVDDQELLCHGRFNEDETYLEPLVDQASGKEFGISFNHSSFITAVGATALRLPDGYGVAVDSSTTYYFLGMLKSLSRPHDGLYSFGITFTFEPVDGGRKIASLIALKVEGMPEQEPKNESFQWDLPPGKHDYSKEFGVPEDFDIHLIDFHLHRFTTAVELREARTGAILYRSEVKETPNGEPLRPLYSSETGIALRKDARYVFQISYDNPLNDSDRTMGKMFLYVAKHSAVQSAPK